MKLINPNKAIELSKRQTKFIADTNSFYLTTNCLIEKRNGEEIIFDNDVTDDTIKPLFLPKKLENIEGQSISYAFEEDIEFLNKNGFEIKKKEFFGNEYIYRTKDFILLEGADFKSFRKHISRFKKTYDYKIFYDYPLDKILEFLKMWSTQKNVNQLSKASQKNFEAELELDVSWLDLIKIIPNKRIFIEIDGELAGFAIFLKQYPNLWVALMQKVNFKYHGITRFLYHLKAKEMEDVEFFQQGIRETMKT